jgi:CTP:molybdopterin cytidylyltransferase MocA
MHEPALVILAAGMGSRFGGVKQLAAVGPNGEVIMDYNASRARAAGFTTIVIVTREALADDLRLHLAGWPPSVDVRVVFQDRDKLAANRPKPLGTAHAALVGMRAVSDTAVAVVNADDLYAADAFAHLARHLTHAEGPGLTTFAVRSTLLTGAPVTRALCDVDEHGRLRTIEEGTVTGTEWRGLSGRTVTLTGDEPVSMNCWGFPATAADALDNATQEFLAAGRAATNDEVLLPEVVRTAMPAAVAFHSAGSCVGVTHPGDLELVRGRITGPAW